MLRVAGELCRGLRGLGRGGGSGRRSRRDDVLRCRRDDVLRHRRRARWTESTGPAVAGTVAPAVVSAAIAIAIARPSAGAGVATRTGTFLAHLVSLEGDLVGIERARRRLIARVRHRAATHPALAVTTAAEHLEVVAADVEARLLDVVLVRVRARAEAAIDEDLHALLDVLLRDLRLPAPAAHAVPVGLLGPLAAAVRDAVHRDGEVTDRLPARGHAHLGVTPNIADDLDLGHRCHLDHSLTH